MSYQQRGVRLAISIDERAYEICTLDIQRQRRRTRDNDGVLRQSNMNRRDMDQAREAKYRDKKKKRKLIFFVGRIINISLL